MLETLFWNPSVKRVLLLPGTRPPDKFAASRLAIDADGSLEPATRAPLLFDQSLTTVVLEGTRTVRRWRSLTLARPTGPVRVTALMVGRLDDGWLLPFGGLTVWPKPVKHAGWVEVSAHAADTGRGTFALRARGGPWRSVALRGGDLRLVRVRACGERPWDGSFRAGNAVAGLPRFVPDPSACAA